MDNTDANTTAKCQRSCHAGTEYQCDAVCRRRFTSADVRRSDTDLLLVRANAVCGVVSWGATPIIRSATTLLACRGLSLNL